MRSAALRKGGKPKKGVRGDIIPNAAEKRREELKDTRIHKGKLTGSALQVHKDTGGSSGPAGMREGKKDASPRRDKSRKGWVGGSTGESI